MSTTIKISSIQKVFLERHEDVYVVMFNEQQLS